MITNYPLLRELKQLKLKNLITFERLAGGAAAQQNDLVTLTNTPILGNDSVIGAVAINCDTVGTVTDLVAGTHFSITSTPQFKFEADLSANDGIFVLYQHALSGAVGNYPLARELENLRLNQLLEFETAALTNTSDTTLGGTPRNGTDGIIDLVGLDISGNALSNALVRETNYTADGTTLTVKSDLSAFESSLILYEKDLGDTVHNYPLARELQELEFKNFLRMEIFAGTDEGDITLGTKPTLGNDGIISILGIDTSAEGTGADDGTHSIAADDGVTLTYGSNMSAYNACVVLYQY